MFDKNQPYGQVSGKIEDAPGARYMQDGVYYNGSGDKVGGKFVQKPVVEVKEAPAPESVTVGIVAPEKKEEPIAPVVDENGNADDVDLNSLTWQALKKMVVAKGDTYTNKADAIKLLSAK